jgi:hypothetical protein
MSAGNDIYDTHGRGKRNRILWSLPATHRYLGRSVLISHSCAKPSHENCPGSSTSRSGQAFGLRWQKSRKSKAYSAAHSISTQHQHTASAHSISTQHQHQCGLRECQFQAGRLGACAWLLTSPHLTSPLGSTTRLACACPGARPHVAPEKPPARHKPRTCRGVAVDTVAVAAMNECGTPCSSGGKQ